MNSGIASMRTESACDMSVWCVYVCSGLCERRLYHVLCIIQVLCTLVFSLIPCVVKGGVQRED